MKWTTQSKILGATQGLAMLILAGGILGFVVKHAADHKGIAYVHVSTPGVDVMIDDSSYYVETLESTPIVHELGAGAHSLRMLRDGVVLYEQEFTLGLGEEIVLTAWETRSSDNTTTPPNDARVELHEMPVPPHGPAHSDRSSQRSERSVPCTTSDGHG